MTAQFPLTLAAGMVARRGKRIIGPVDLTLAGGGPTMVIGPNGAGKSTLLRVMHGIERINAGAVRWAQDDPAAHAFVFQTPTMMRRSVAENLAYPLRLLGQGRGDISMAVDQWLARIGLSDAASQRASRLSAGERQKLAIARALIRAPDVVFLDEPCANLDGHATREIEALLLEVAAKGTRLVMATHDMGQARRLAGDVVFLLDGQVHETGSAAHCFSDAASPELLAFLRGDIVT